MAQNIALYRGGTPVFRPSFCCGDYAEFSMPVDTPHFAGTPPFDSHADGERGQGYLNLSYPFVPNLLDTTAHRWMLPPLRKLSAVGDIVQLIWVPMRGFVDSLYMELTRFDSNLDGVYIEPVAQRAVWDFAKEEWNFVDVAAFTSAVNTYGNVTKLPLGTPGSDDPPYLIARFPQINSDLPVTFGHNLVKRNAAGEPTGGLDDAYGPVVLGIKISEGTAAKIKQIWMGKFELWVCAKFFAFECHTFTG